MEEIRQDYGKEKRKGRKDMVREERDGEDGEAMVGRRETCTKVWQMVLNS